MKGSGLCREDHYQDESIGLGRLLGDGLERAVRLRNVGGVTVWSSNGEGPWS